MPTYFGTTANDTLTGTTGNDIFFGGPGADVINGGSGLDVMVITGKRADYTITGNATSSQVTTNVGVDGNDTLNSIERVQFNDVNVALDVSGNAGSVAKIIGAVFGAAAVANPIYEGIGLSLIDGGMSYDALAQYAIENSGLAMNTAGTNEAVVSLLWSNVVGTPIPAEQKAYYVGLLNGGMTIGALTKLAADTTENATNIKLNTLATTGIEYQPYGASKFTLASTPVAADPPLKDGGATTNTLYTIASGTYTKIISDFGSGDVLRPLFSNYVFNVTSDSNLTDGIKTLTFQDPATSSTTTVILTGLTPAQDAATVDLNSLISTFGAGTIEGQAGTGGAIAVPVSAANVGNNDATLGAVTYTIAPITNSYAFGISGFAAGDKLAFPAGTSFSITNVSGTDGNLVITGTSAGNTVTINLVGLATASDGGIFSQGSFNTVFGAGSLA